MSRIDIVTVFHNETNRAQARKLVVDVQRHEPDGDIRFFLVDNRIHNRGFAAGCNTGAFHPKAKAPIIGFLNPDVEVGGPFIAEVGAALHRPVVITGCRYDKPQRLVDAWGVHDWVCGATLFVTREWFTSVRGFDRRFVWSHEETDLIRQAETQGLAAKSIRLPLGHRSPDVDTDEDTAYKRKYAAEGDQLYFQKWGH